LLIVMHLPRQVVLLVPEGPLARAIANVARSTVGGPMYLFHLCGYPKSHTHRIWGRRQVSGQGLGLPPPMCLLGVASLPFPTRVCVCMYECIYMYIYIHIYIYIWTYPYIHIHIYTYMHIFTLKNTYISYIYIYVYVCIYICMSINQYMYTRIYIFTYICIKICTYIYVHTSTRIYTIYSGDDARYRYVMHIQICH